MSENTCRGFILPNSLAAVSAVPLSGLTLATDGMESVIHIFDLCGRYLESTATVRPYFKLRRSTGSERFTALHCCQSARVYFLDAGYRELGYVTLETDGSEDMSEITDASLVISGGTSMIAASFRRSAFLFDIDGKRVMRLADFGEGAFIRSFVGEFGFWGAAYVRNGITFIRVVDGDNIFDGTVEENLSVRQIIRTRSGFSVLYGSSYIYNYIFPLYANGILNLPGGSNIISLIGDMCEPS